MVVFSYLMTVLRLEMSGTNNSGALTDNWLSRVVTPTVTRYGNSSGYWGMSMPNSADHLIMNSRYFKLMAMDYYFG